jgi:hypothetical protein
MPPDTVKQVNISFPIKFSVVAGLIHLGLTAWFYVETQSVKEALIFFAIGAAAVGQLTATFYTARLLGSAMKSAEHADRAADRQLVHDELTLKREALRFGERWNDPAMKEARATLKNLVENSKGEPNQLADYLKENDMAAGHVMNFIEEMATCCRFGLVDEPIMKRQFDYVVILTWQTLVLWIQETRRRSSNGIWEDTEWLYNQWKPT